MNTSKTIVNDRIVGGDYFVIKYLRKSNKYLSDFLPLFNFDDYWCYKVTNRQRQVTYGELLDFEYSGYIFFKKDLYYNKHIDMWIENLKIFSGYTSGIQYLNIPFPPYHPNKIIIKK
jgi:hypothetical protein